MISLSTESGSNVRFSATRTRNDNKILIVICKMDPVIILVIKIWQTIPSALQMSTGQYTLSNICR